MVSFKRAYTSAQAHQSPFIKLRLITVANNMFLTLIFSLYSSWKHIKILQILVYIWIHIKMFSLKYNSHLHTPVLSPDKWTKMLNLIRCTRPLLKKPKFKELQKERTCFGSAGVLRNDCHQTNMSLTLLVFQDTAGEPLYKLYKALKHQVEKGPVDAKMKKAKYTLNDTGLLGDDVEYSVLVSTQTLSNTKRHVKRRVCFILHTLSLLCVWRVCLWRQTLQVLVHGEGPDVTPVKVLNCDTISQVGVCFSAAGFLFSVCFLELCSPLSAAGEDFILLSAWRRSR